MLDDGVRGGVDHTHRVRVGIRHIRMGAVRAHGYEARLGADADGGGDGAGAGRVTAVDVSALALATAWLQSQVEGLRIQVMRGDLLTPVADRCFDLIVANPS
ncbi:methyltransferase domain-containing protein [Streptomyces milbemycinicus]|uniref:methyltransferase domain-containing protein n=1 Tax=Streptomyces milbemycinicus TaxID=476552 RepID=UPI0033E2E6C8